MKKLFISRAATFAVSGVMATFFGFAGQASAATIANTGPNSTNIIRTTQRTICDVDNSNHVSLHNSNNQNAVSGNATVGGGWGSWDPAVWQSQGHSYEEWHAAFMDYMSSHEGDWSQAWSGGNTTGGDATTGDAGNVNTTSAHVNVHNDAGCAPAGAPAPGGPAGGEISNTGPDSHNAVLASSTARTDVRNTNTLGVHNSNNQSAASGTSTVRGNTSGGDATSGGAGNNNGTNVGGSVSNSGPVATGPAGGTPGGVGGGGASISNTGPNSSNTISFSSHNSTTITNTNTLNFTNTSNQSAHSGNATVSGNTSGGDATTGDAGNWNATSISATVEN